MADFNRMVAHFLDGKVLKGTSQNFLPSRPSFQMRRADTGAPVTIEWRALKAVFSVKDFVGNRLRQDIQGFVRGPAENAHGNKIAVRFADNELLCGYTHAYAPGRDGFFVFPSDPNNNILRVYVLRHATREIGVGPDADRMAKAASRPHAA